MTTDTFHLLVAWAALGGVGCSSTSHATSTAILRPDIGEVPPELAKDYEVFAQNCSKCHSIERPLTAPVSDNHHWELYVAKMMRTPGSGISAAEAPHILRFLFWYTDRKAGRIAAYQQRTAGKTADELAQSHALLPDETPPQDRDASTLPAQAPATPEPAGESAQ